ncbi:DUF4386 family protein [Pedococcus bigeumensis]|nr:DUF4386 family protein [Pedococcus bigeumensis]
MTNSVIPAQSTSTPPAQTPSTPLRRRLSALALAGAGVGIVAGHALSIDSGQGTAAYLADFTAHHLRGTMGGLSIALGAFLLVPGLVSLLRLVTGRGARLATIAAALWGTGAIALGAGDVMQTLVMSALVPTHPDTARAVIEVAQQGILGLPFLFAPAFVLGGTLFAIALLRARTVPTWLGVLTLFGPLLVPASSAGGLLTAAVPLLPLGAALVLLSLRAEAPSHTDCVGATEPRTIHYDAPPA